MSGRLYFHTVLLVTFVSIISNANGQVCTFPSCGTSLSIWSSTCNLLCSAGAYNGGVCTTDASNWISCQCNGAGDSTKLVSAGCISTCNVGCIACGHVNGGTCTSVGNIVRCDCNA